ncbi:uncharacterized protein IL334_007477 [Kwoniella shivajii]|uniref:Major facilitator superfamily (MFS) profile domain-containing protein n=1 Tax=Kwoniella shivajii TaxID=564305 RepID=A0ABZ1D8S4_9TREE|nr:hypothetical protein IL334_007477 [Kwoniella shivajii]
MIWNKNKDDINHDPEELAKRGLDPQASIGHVKTKEEKRFLMKLDLFLLTFGCISQVIKYIDQTNINTAYVSGMSEALNLHGNELNYFTTYFNVGYCLFLIPSQVMITRIRPSLWLPGLELFWGILTGCIAACKNAKSIYAIRAFIGIAESSAYPGTVTLLNRLVTWYTPTEMAKRIGFYHSCQAFGGMMSGAMQTAIHESLEGRSGIAGWQWTFIINCIMTIIVALAGPFMIPDFPNNPNPRAFWLNDSDMEIARERLARYTRESPNPINFKTLFRTLKNPILYCLIYIYVGMLIAPSGNSYFQLWLKSLKDANGNKLWGVSALNAIPLGGFAMQVTAVWLFAFSSDFFKTRWLILLIICILGSPSAIMMAIWKIPDGAKYFSYFSLYFCTSSGPPLWSWMSDMLPRDAEQRALIIGICISMYYAVNAWSNVLIWPTKQAPHYLYGWPVCVALWITCGLVIVSLRIYDIKIVRPRNYRIAQETHEENMAAEYYTTEAKAEDDMNGIEKDMVTTNVQTVPTLRN